MIWAIDDHYTAQVTFDMTLFECLSRIVRLKWSKLDLISGVSVDHEVHKPMAKVTHAIKENDHDDELCAANTKKVQQKYQKTNF